MSKLKPKPMRETMPTVAGWVDDLREAFGREAVIPSIYAGTHGEADQFHATEGSHQVGTPFTESEGWTTVSE